ncbi:Ras GTPase activating protein ira2 [Blyttiomyces sp. JEL0837]|nr:Ras GTPase activating protein ira2 [Blyttiomyces sp. JEL0837]
MKEPGSRGSPATPRRKYLSLTLDGPIAKMYSNSSVEQRIIATLVANNCNLLAVICQATFVGETAANVSRGILSLLRKQKGNATEKFLKRLIKIKLDECGTMTTMLLSAYAKYEGLAYVSYSLSTPLNAISSELSECEIDRQRLAKDVLPEVIQQNEQRLVHCCDTLLQSLWDKKEGMPASIRRMCHFLRDIIDDGDTGDFAPTDSNNAGLGVVKAANQNKNPTTTTATTTTATPGTTPISRQGSAKKIRRGSGTGGDMYSGIRVVKSLTSSPTSSSVILECFDEPGKPKRRSSSINGQEMMKSARSSVASLPLAASRRRGHSASSSNGVNGGDIVGSGIAEHDDEGRNAGNGSNGGFGLGGGGGGSYGNGGGNGRSPLSRSGSNSKENQGCLTPGAPLRPKSKSSSGNVSSSNASMTSSDGGGGSGVVGGESGKIFKLFQSWRKTNKGSSSSASSTRPGSVSEKEKIPGSIPLTGGGYTQPQNNTVQTASSSSKDRLRSSLSNLSTTNLRTQPLQHNLDDAPSSWQHSPRPASADSHQHQHHSPHPHLHHRSNSESSEHSRRLRRPNSADIFHSTATLSSVNGFPTASQQLETTTQAPPQIRVSCHRSALGLMDGDETDSVIEVHDGSGGVGSNGDGRAAGTGPSSEGDALSTRQDAEVMSTATTATDTGRNLGLRDMAVVSRISIGSAVTRSAGSLTPGEKVVGSFLMLRFIIPAIIAPDANGLMEGRLSSSTRRGLVLAGKVLTALCNDVEFTSKEDYLIPMNGFLKENRSKIKDFLGFASLDDYEPMPESRNPINIFSDQPDETSSICSNSSYKANKRGGGNAGGGLRNALSASMPCLNAASTGPTTTTSSSTQPFTSSPLSPRKSLNASTYLTTPSHAANSTTKARTSTGSLSISSSSPVSRSRSTEFLDMDGLFTYLGKSLDAIERDVEERLTADSDDVEYHDHGHGRGHGQHNEGGAGGVGGGTKTEGLLSSFLELKRAVEASSYAGEKSLRGSQGDSSSGGGSGTGGSESGGKNGIWVRLKGIKDYFNSGKFHRHSTEDLSGNSTSTLVSLGSEARRL